MDAVHFVRVLGAPDMLQTSAFVSLLMTLVSAACGDSQDLPDEREIARRTLELCQGAVALIVDQKQPFERVVVSKEECLRIFEAKPLEPLAHQRR